MSLLTQFRKPTLADWAASALLLATVLLFGLGCCSSKAPAARPGISALVAPAMRATVAIRKQCWMEGATPEEMGAFRYCGMGSGLCLDARGYILTAAHVVGDAGPQTIITVDIDATRLGVPAVVVALDPRLDLALVKVDAVLSNLVVWGNSETLLAGDGVFVVGFPFDTFKSAQRGIVSTTRAVRDFPMIQTDAAMNPGHSGGGMFDDRGELVGICDEIVCAQGLRAFTGVAYAIPGNTARLFVIRNMP